METLAIAQSTTSDLERFAAALTPPAPDRLRVSLRPGDVQNGLGKLVLTVVELIRQLLERQAIRRIEAGSLSDDEIERLGVTFLQLASQIKLLQEQFGLSEDELNLDLGPLGKLL